MRLLVVEDEADLVSALRVRARPRRLRRGRRDDGAAAEAKLAISRTTSSILDLMLPDTNGFDLCRRLRSGEIEARRPGRLRVLTLTARAALADRVRGLDDGADDYLTKPFALVELLARIRALLRRDATNGSTQSRTSATSSWTRPATSPPAAAANSR